MSSGFSGGLPDFYTGRSTMNINNPQGLFRQNLAGILPETSFHRSDFIGKRSLSDFQYHQHQQQQQQQQNLGFYLRNVKARNYQHSSPISPLPPVENSFFQQLRPQNHNFSGVDAEIKMRNQLQELEKAMLNDDFEEIGDAVSNLSNVTTSEWSSETIQNLISPISPSSSCSSTCSPVVTSPKELILEVANAISDENTKQAREILTRLEKIGNTKGTAEQRLTAYMAAALKSRVNSAEYPPPVTELYRKDHLSSTQIMYEISPCFKLGFMAANYSILDSVFDQKHEKIHVIEFDIGKGGQYVHLLHALSRRRSEKQFGLKITTFADSGDENRLKLVGDGLEKVSNQLDVNLTFNVIKLNSSPINLTRETLGVQSDEALCVNLAFRLFKLPDESVTTENLRDSLLRQVKKLSPAVVTVVEQELKANTASLVARVTDACGYYSALFESLDAIVPKEHPERLRIEEGLGRKIANSVACEGRDRVERCEVFGKWRVRMGMAGFELKPITQTIADSLRLKLNSGPRGNPGFTVNEDAGGVCFGWMARTLTVTSAWR